MDKKQNLKKTVPPIDFPSALERIGGDESFLEELLGLYSEDFSEKLNQIKEAIDQGNYDMIRELSHTLKGASANLSLIPLQEASFEMENAGREGNIEKAKKTLELLEKEYQRLQDFLAENKEKNQ
jgi:HPt (histidine-containing phosphotransfer) domain-containing protein